MDEDEGTGISRVRNARSIRPKPFGSDAGPVDAELDEGLHRASAAIFSTFASYAAAIQRARSRITRFLPPNMFGNPAFDILLDLFVAAEAGQQRMVKDCALSARTPLSTTLRWLALMEKEGLIVRRGDPEDGRRTLISLTESARDAVCRYLADASAIPLRHD